MLYRALNKLPMNHNRKREWLTALTNSRRGGWGGWQDLGVIRRPGDFIVGEGYCDPRLPDGVEAVWLYLHYIAPSLAVIVATFTLTEEACDLSALLREDYQTRLLDISPSISVKIKEQFRRVRPGGFRPFRKVSRVEDWKRQVCDTLIRRHEEACGQWLTGAFPGWFSTSAAKSRPIMRLMFTQEQVPFKDREAVWLRPVGLHEGFDVWRSTEPPGWALNFSVPLRRDGEYIATVAARRKNATNGSTAAENAESNWYLTQQFATWQGSLAARYATTSLLSIYGDRLSDLRDRAGTKYRPVREARKLNEYLIGDGLDIATITADVRLLVEDLARFRWCVPEYTEDLDVHSPDLYRKREPREFIPFLCDQLSNQATRLVEDSTTTTGNIRASAELQQAIANTTLQRVLLALAVIAIIISVITPLWPHPSPTSTKPPPPSHITTRLSPRQPQQAPPSTLGNPHTPLEAAHPTPAPPPTNQTRSTRPSSPPVPMVFE
jgi:hypothetical protein